MSLKPGVRRGSQAPRIESRPKNIDVVERGEDAFWLMEQVGRPLLDWQKYVVNLMLAERKSGRYSAYEIALNVPRQNGKNVCLEARELFGLYLDEDCKVITHSAHEFKTARKSFRELEDLIRRTPMLWRRVKGAEGKHHTEDVRGIRTGAGEMSITLEDDSKINYQARSKDGGRGLTGDLVVLDEAYDLTADEIGAMMPTMAGRSMDGNPQIIYTSSAGMMSSEYWESVRERGIAGDEPRLLYLEWSAEDDAESTDIDAWYEANPSLGFLISEEYVRETELKGMPDEQFRRERLGIWARIDDDIAINARDWEKLEDTDSLPSENIVFGVDIPPTRDSATVSVASVRDDGFVHVELVDCRVGSEWITERLFELQEKHHPVAIVVDAGSAMGGLVPELQGKGVKVKQVRALDYFQACGRFYDLVKQGKIRHIGQDELTGAVEGAKMKFNQAGLFKWVQRTGVENISPLVAGSLAVSALNKYGYINKPSAPVKRMAWKVRAL